MKITTSWFGMGKWKLDDRVHANSQLEYVCFAKTTLH